MTGARLGGVATLVLLAVGWVLFAPQPVGGQTTYVTTQGTSMLPRFHSGDLAVLRPGTYRVGDIVAYRSATNQVVMHRIVGRDGDRYVVKGDHNTWLDPDRPAKSALIGKLWLRIPRGGLVLRQVVSPPVLALLALILVLAVAPQTRRRRRRRRSGGSAVRTPAVFPALARQARSALPALAVTAGVAMVVAGYALTRPATRVASSSVPYTQAVTFGYSAPGPPGPTYSGQPLTTGDPVFLRLVTTLQVSADYSFSSTAPAVIAGSGRMVADLQLANGWHRTLPLNGTQQFDGTRVRLTATLDPAELLALGGQVAAETGVPASSYTVAVGPDLQIAGQLSSHSLTATFAPRFSFSLNSLQLKPDGHGDMSPPSQSGTLSVPSTRAATVSVLGRRVGVGNLRLLALAVALLAGAATAAAYRVSHSAVSDPDDAITAKYATLLVPVVPDVELSAQRIISVESMDALARIAQRYERLILHLVRDGRHAYFVEDDGCLYRYSADAPARQPAGPPSGGGPAPDRPRPLPAPPLTTSAATSATLPPQRPLSEA